MGYPLVYITFIYLQLMIQARYNFILYNNNRHAIVTMWRLLCIVDNGTRHLVIVIPADRISIGK